MFTPGSTILTIISDGPQQKVSLETVIESVLKRIDANVASRIPKDTLRFPDDDFTDNEFKQIVEKIKEHVKKNKYYETHFFWENGSAMYFESHIQMRLKGESKTGWGYATPDWVFDE